MRLQFIRRRATEMHIKKVCELEEGYQLVVCSGGDGTIDEVVTGMMQREHEIPIGYIPTGTTNDFANSLHIPKDILMAAHTSVNGGAVCV